MRNRRLARLLLVAVIATGAAACVRIDSGQMGVKWRALTGTADRAYGEGWNIVLPWDRMFVYSVRLQDRKEDLHILANNGLSIALETSVRFRVDPDELVPLHVEIGPDYYNSIVAPILRSEARKVGGRYSPEEIYSSKREAVENEILSEVAKAITGRHIKVQAILIRNVDLPDNIKRAISDKLEEEQKALKMTFTLVRERQEAERKRIEAQGVADFQRIVSEGLTADLLRWKGIEATEKLAGSSNAKVVVIGGKDGMPLILGGQ
jgi:regulator of protease activity HflC (stomatin/prohibitin superfamily)